MGRGLRLCVNQEGERNESYSKLVSGLQSKIERDTNIKFGIVEKHSFANVTRADNQNFGENIYMGYDKSEELYKYLGMNKRKLDTWDFNILTSYEGFENPFGRKATKNRKLYNGKLKCYYYQYFDNEKIKNHGDMVVNHI